ncbi:MAG: MBL fold metallo-hydrolase [bacterium]|nr:MBL fold metallo-hydrolase [bacterium]
MKRNVLTALVAVVFLFGSPPFIHGEVRFHFIDVGHGDAILIEQEGLGLALVDAGKPEAGPIVLRYLDSLKISSLDHVFLTHNHDDHIGGVPLILDSVDVGTVHVTGASDDWPTAAKMTTYLQSGRWIVDTTEVGEAILLSDDLLIQVLSPQRAEVAGKSVDSNLYSMVLMVTHHQIKVLLAADINHSRETWLVQQYGKNLESNLLKVPHHASAKSCSAEFLKIVHPEIAIICIGPNNWGYPSDEMIMRLKQNCATVLRTDEYGSVALSSDGQRLNVIKPEVSKP